MAEVQRRAADTEGEGSERTRADEGPKGGEQRPDPKAGEQRRDPKAGEQRREESGEGRHPPARAAEQGKRVGEAQDKGAPPDQRRGARSRLLRQSEVFSAVADRVHLGALVAGIALIVFGLLLLGGTEVSWRGLLDGALAATGLALILLSRRGGSTRGLLLAGLLLAVVMLGVWRADVPMQGGMRFRTVTPVTLQDLATPYRQTAGTLSIDLRRVDLTRLPPSPAQLAPMQASVGVGRLVVVLPPGLVLQGTALAGGGRVAVVAASKSGAGVELPLSTPNAPARIPADLRVGVGTVEVQLGKSP